MHKNEWALIKKDMLEILSSKQVVWPMIFVPLLFVLLFPAVLLIGAAYVRGDSELLTEMAPLLAQLPQDYAMLTPAQLLIKLAVDYIFPSFFLMIPIMSSGIIGASSFIGEKEHHTMETLLYTPISMEQLMRVKILGVFIPAYAVTLISFLVFAIIINIGGVIYFNDLIFPNVKWLLIIGWLAPAICLLSLIFTVLISARATTFQGAQQISGLLVLPIILVLIGQMSGLFILDDVVLIVLGGLLLVLDYFLIKRVARTFKPEKLI